MSANEPYRLEELFCGSQAFGLGYMNGPYRPEIRKQPLGVFRLRSWKSLAKGRIKPVKAVKSCSHPV
jgi:hypothetical protein